MTASMLVFLVTSKIMLLNEKVIDYGVFLMHVLRSSRPNGPGYSWQICIRMTKLCRICPVDCLHLHCIRRGVAFALHRSQACVCNHSTFK